MRTLCLTILTYCVLFAVARLVAQSDPSAGSLSDSPVFQQNCAKCHGKAAQGRLLAGPSLVSEKSIAMSADDLRNIITNGKGRMPKYGNKLKPEEIAALVEAIKAHQPKSAK